MNQQLRSARIRLPNRGAREHLDLDDLITFCDCGHWPRERHAKLAACFLELCPFCHEAVATIAAKHQSGRALFDQPVNCDVDLIGRVIARLVLLASQAGKRERQMLMPSHLEPAERAIEDGMAFAQLVQEEALYVIDDAPERGLEAAIAALDFARAEGERRRGPWGGLERHGQVLVARAWLRRGRHDHALAECPSPRDWGTSVHGAIVEARAHQILAEVALGRYDEVGALDHLQKAGAVVCNSEASDPRLAEAYWELGRLRSILDPENAVHSLDAALARLPKDRYGLLRLRVLDRLAWVHVELGQLDRAEALLGQAAPLYPLACNSLLVAEQAYLSAILAIRRGDAEEASLRIHDALAILEERRREPEETAALVVLALLPLAATFENPRFESDLRSAFRRLGRWPEAMTIAFELVEAITGDLEREAVRQLETWGGAAGNGDCAFVRRMLEELKNTGANQ